MAWVVSADIEDALRRAAERHLPGAALHGRALSQAIIDRSRRYTSERERLHEPVDSAQGPADLAARALFFTVADAAKVMVPMAELERAGLLPAPDTIEILDLGAGAGAMSLGALDYLHRRGALTTSRGARICAVDRDGGALQIMGTAVAELAERWGVPIAFTPMTRDVRDMRGIERASGRADLILAGTVINELDRAGAESLIEQMMGMLGPGGAAIIMEPALRVTARPLHELRDWIVARGHAHVVAPCTRQIAPCPALADDSDWCHEDRPTVLPARAARLAAATGLRGHGLKFAYLVLRAGSGAAPNAGPGRTAMRVVSQPRKSKGKLECYVCSDAGRARLRLLKRHAGPGSADFERVRRGDVLIARADLAGGGDIQPGDEVDAIAVQPPGSTPHG